MSQVSAILRRGRSGFMHWCPACERMYMLPDGWAFNGNLERPTFHPSFKHGGKLIMVEDGRWTGDWVRDKDGKTVDGTCHYIVSEGKLQFFADSWHHRTDLVDMPPIPPHLIDHFD